MDNATTLRGAVRQAVLAFSSVSGQTIANLEDLIEKVAVAVEAAQGWSPVPDVLTARVSRLEAAVNAIVKDIVAFGQSVPTELPNTSVSPVVNPTPALTRAEVEAELRANPNRTTQAKGETAAEYKARVEALPANYPGNMTQAQINAHDVAQAEQTRAEAAEVEAKRVADAKRNR